MVRIEKMLNERLLNIKLLGRARNIVGPSKLNPNEEVILRMSPMYSFLAKWVPRKVSLWLNSLDYRYFRFMTLSRGLSWDDTMQPEDDIRRDTTWEHVVRENMNPYHLTLTRYRRHRYFKTDLALDGFQPQEEIINDAKNRYFILVRQKILEWKRVMHLYQAEMIPRTRWTNGSVAGILDFAYIPGLFGRVGWNRVFFNEEHYLSDKVVLDDIKKNAHKSKSSPQHFEERVLFLNKYFPGLLCPDGQEIDFAKLKTDLEKSPSFKYGNQFDLLGYFTLFFKRNQMPYVNTTARKAVIDTPCNIGLDMPEAIAHKSGTSIM